MGPRLDTGGWLALTQVLLSPHTQRDSHPVRYTELSSARERQFLALRLSDIDAKRFLIIYEKQPTSGAPPAKAE